MKIQVGFENKDYLEIESSEDVYPIQNFKVVTLYGCHEFLNRIQEYKSKYGKGISSWPEPQGAGHVDLLMRELILKMNGRWEFPYTQEELCHCRQILTRDVDAVIVWGANSVSLVSAMTTASTACGTCRPDIEKILKRRYR